MTRRVAVPTVPKTTVMMTTALMTLALMCGVSVSAGAADPAFGWPLAPKPIITAAFDPPEFDWLPGHRGVDLAGTEGQSVVSMGAGTVVFAGTVGGKPVVSVDHPNGLRSTYEPVSASVTPGQLVARGQRLGSLVPGHANCPAPACLHWGLRRGREYLDPVGAVGSATIRLEPILDW